MRQSTCYALAALAALALLAFGAGPAAAMTKKQCDDKKSGCYGRCWKNPKHDTFEKVYNCYQRTCDKQYATCLASVPSKPATMADPGTGPTPPKDPKTGVVGTTGGGLLDPGQGTTGQGPAQTGTPLTPAAPTQPALR